MKFKEIFTTDNGIFSTIFYTYYPVEYKIIFGDVLPTVYDVLVNFKVGNKQLLYGLTDENCKDIVKSIIAINIDNWVKAAKAMFAEYDVLTPIKVKTSRNETSSVNNESTDKQTESKKAFNDTEFTPDNETAKESSQKHINTLTTDEVISGVGIARDISESVLKEFNLRLEKWRENIIFAIVNEITIDVY